MMSRGRKKPTLYDLALQLPQDDDDSTLIELEGDSDRACALIAVSILDRALVGVLATQMVKVPADEHKSLFYGQTAFLGSFSNKIRLCYVLSLISKEQVKHLNTMRDVRNYFAHSLGPASFNDPIVVAECATLWSDADPIAPRISHLSKARAKFLARWMTFSRELPAIYISLLRRSGYFSDAIIEALTSYIHSPSEPKEIPK
jgi:hypothetical protein